MVSLQLLLCVGYIRLSRTLASNPTEGHRKCLLTHYRGQQSLIGSQVGLTAILGDAFVLYSDLQKVRQNFNYWVISMKLLDIYV